MNSRCGKDSNNKASINGKIYNIFQTFSRRLNFCTLFVCFKMCSYCLGVLFIMRQVTFMPVYMCVLKFSKIKQKKKYSKISHKIGFWLIFTTVVSSLKILCEGKNTLIRCSYF